jgi:hypothetical protein
MILEGLVTSVSAAGEINIAPMGPRVDSAMRRLVLRPFPTSQTYRNLREHGEGVFHVTDDVLLLARATIGPVDPLPALMDAKHVKGHILCDTCGYYEFRVASMDTSQERVAIEVEVIHSGSLRDFFGFNRAKHAVVEAAIFASRIHILPRSEIKAEFRKLGILVDKTGGPHEQEAFALLLQYIERPGAEDRPA